MSVTVVSCLYGHAYDKFTQAWWRSVDDLQRKPEAVVTSQGGRCDWAYPQAFFLQRAIERADTDWVWILDIDDTALPDALNGIDDVTADVWMCGFERSDGEVYIPPALTAAEVLASPKNLIPAGSAIRTEAFRACGGFRDIAYQDWELWRSLARRGATFKSSGRANYRYNLHPSSRSATELTPERRDEHRDEMLRTEGWPLAV